MSKFKATSLITDKFNDRGLIYSVRDLGREEILVDIPVQGGPLVYMKMISSDNHNDVAIRLPCLFSHIPDEKRIRMMEACNYINMKVRFLKFIVDNDNDLNLEYDLPQSMSDDCVGESAMEMLIRTSQILKDFYPLLSKALYTDEDLRVLSGDALPPSSGHDDDDEDEEEEDGDEDIEPNTEQIQALAELIARMHDSPDEDSEPSASDA